MGVFRSIHNIVYAISFRAEKFYCETDLGGGVLFKIWERPGEWCSDGELENILKDVQVIADEAQSGKHIPQYGVLTGNREDLKNRFITIGYDKKLKKPIAFSAQIYLDVPVGVSIIEVLHMGLVYVSPGSQKKSILGLLYILPNIILLIKRGFRPIWASNVSQVPAIIGVVADYYEQVYPDPIHTGKQSILHRSLGNGIMKFHRKAFGVGEDAVYDASKQIISNAYTGGSDNLKKTFEQCPKYRIEKVNFFCKESLNYERGDDVLQLGILSGSLITNFFQKRIAGISGIYSLLFISITAVFTLLLPVLRWLTRKTD